MGSGRGGDGEGMGSISVVEIVWCSFIGWLAVGRLGCFWLGYWVVLVAVEVVVVVAIVMVVVFCVVMRWCLCHILTQTDPSTYHVIRTYESRFWPSVWPAGLPFFCVRGRGTGDVRRTCMLMCLWSGINAGGRCQGVHIFYPRRHVSTMDINRKRVCTRSV